jgi:hypothetical protein
MVVVNVPSCRARSCNYGMKAHQNGGSDIWARSLSYIVGDFVFDGVRMGREGVEGHILLGSIGAILR